MIKKVVVRVLFLLAQTDLVTFSPIIFWSFFVFILSLIFFFNKIIPFFIYKEKVLLKVENINFLKTIFFIQKIKIIENFNLILDLKKFIKAKKSLWF